MIHKLVAYILTRYNVLIYPHIEGIKGATRLATIIENIVHKIGIYDYTDWEKTDEGIITWNGYSWGGGENPLEVSSINFNFYRYLERYLGPENIESTLELGCGYGRITPYIDIFSDNTVGLDPNKDMISKAKEHYPEINFKHGKGQNMPFDDGEFSLIVTRGVLQHIPDDQVKQVSDELERVTNSSAKLLLAEDTEGKKSKDFHPRSPEKYEIIFNSFELIKEEKLSHPSGDVDSSRRIMLLQRT